MYMFTNMVKITNPHETQIQKNIILFTFIYKSIKINCNKGVLKKIPHTL